MTRSSMVCPKCSTGLGRVNRPSGIFHPVPGVHVVFVDLNTPVIQIACATCGERISLRARRVDVKPP